MKASYVHLACNGKGNDFNPFEYLIWNFTMAPDLEKSDNVSVISYPAHSTAAGEGICSYTIAGLKPAPRQVLPSWHLC